MKILVLSNLYPPDTIGGYERGCKQVVESLRARGHEVRVLTSAPRQTPVAPEPDVKRVFKLVDIWDHYDRQKSAPATLHLLERESNRVNAFNVHSLLTETEDFQPDIVYVWMLVGLGGLGLMACLHYLRVPWVWHLMDDVPLILCKASGKLVPTFVREFERQLRGHWIPCSQQLVDEIETGGIRLYGSVEVIPNWIVGPRVEPRKAYLQDGQLRIVTTAGLIERQVDKGVDLLIEAAALLRDSGHDNFSIDIYGQVADPHFPALLRKHELTDRVQFCGSRTLAELMSLYPSYDLFAFPTRPREPFGFAPLEAAACGCAPLITQTCGISEWLVHGVHALKARRTAEAFARTLAEVLEGSIDLELIGRRVSAVVRRDFHIDTILPRIEEVLERASRKPRNGAGKPADAYRMAMLAEKLDRVLIQEVL
ncbi:MAG TPA: glycosyltransferase family 4 protein [Isosphaeraceae bacterium]|nr:glycosyltransferase family 4 protein [Isosphaeraceae bacterium]